jgi:hypothetical protein
MHNSDPSLDRCVKIVWRLEQVSWVWSSRSDREKRSSSDHNYSAKKIKTLKTRGEHSVICRFLLCVLGDLEPNPDDKWGMGILVNNKLSAKFNIITTVKFVLLIQAAMSWCPSCFFCVTHYYIMGLNCTETWEQWEQNIKWTMYTEILFLVNIFFMCSQPETKQIMYSSLMYIKFQFSIRNFGPSIACMVV